MNEPRMPMKLPQPPLLLITDRAQAKGAALDVIVRAAFAGGCRWLMVRDKSAGDEERFALARACMDLARPVGAQVAINGDIELARRVGADAVHLRQAAVAERDWGKAGWRGRVGISCHSLEEAREAERAGADYVTLSPVFLTRSKPGYGPALGLDGLARATAALSLPVVALAGVDDAARARGCLDAGAAGVAVMGAIMGAADPESAMRELLWAF